MSDWTIPDPDLTRLLQRGADLQARFLLLNLVERLYVGPGNTPVNAAIATLHHAMYYLEDRIGYEMDPAPKGKIKLLEVQK